MNEKRKKYLDIISKNLLVCSNKTVNEVLDSLISEEKSYVVSRMNDFREEKIDNQNSK